MFASRDVCGLVSSWLPQGKLRIVSSPSYNEADRNPVLNRRFASISPAEKYGIGKTH